MARQRFFLTIIVAEDQLEDGPIVTSPMGGALTYESVDEAGDAARALVAGGTVRGAFVQKLVPVALYTPQSVAKFDAVQPKDN